MSAAAVIAVAQAEVGYLEKASNAQLDDPTANPGKNNYTKYGAWYDGGSLQAQPWCDMFVSWCAAQAGEAEAVGQFAYVPSHKAFFEKQGRYFSRGSVTPQAGDVVIFRNESHIGLVEWASGGYVHTIEGNTSGGSGLEANGGGVFRKTYALTSSYILGYGRPAYASDASNGSAGTSGTAGTEPTTETEEFAVAKTYQNGSTSEPIYADTGLTNKIGSLNPWESCPCLGIVEGRYLVYYPVDGTDQYKAGFAQYHGGLA